MGHVGHIRHVPVADILVEASRILEQTAQGGGGGDGARKEAAEERRRSLSPSERSSQRGQEQDDEYGGSDLSPITRRSRTLLHNMKGERRCITDLANRGLLTLL
ncbi:hypothetical protein PPROV_001119400 [Pycnococcus provasolii]|uniref:Uncharacterized protein n=1 Tax=Pycnococcus provasolii TaxID=41880 RepID=A0A830HYC8_9CHLO|nr:hypothetical protein PPROV_001119400 [Pycnococcus provasolii]